MGKVENIIQSIVQGQERLGDAAEKEIRFVIESGEQGPDDPVAVLKEAYGFSCWSEPLFTDLLQEQQSGADALQGFVLLHVPGVSWEAFPESPFELTNDMRDRLKARSVEPDLETGYFPDGLESYSQPKSMEGKGEAVGCWARLEDGFEAAHGLDWALKSIRAPQAWAFSKESGRPAYGYGIRVFQPDTGVAEHRELEPGMLNMDLGVDLLNGGGRPVDPLDYGFGQPGHGTGTASVVASRRENRLTGAAPAAELVPVRCINSVVRLSQTNVAKGVQYAHAKGAKVVTMSLGGLWSTSLHKAIRNAVRDNIIVLAAAGNCWPWVVWPACYDDVVAVAGCNVMDEKWQGSSSGPQVTITAPAEFVPRAYRELKQEDLSQVTFGQGTSFAVALVAGVAALWLAHHGRENIIASLAPGETVQDRFMQLLRATARKSPHLPEDKFGAGIVDANALLRAGTRELDKSAKPSVLSESRRYASLESGYATGSDAALASLLWQPYAMELSWRMLERDLWPENGLKSVRSFHRRHDGTFAVPVSDALQRAAEEAGITL